MNILITNDDGINAQGIAVLARAAAGFGRVTVVAPARQCSAMSHRITLGRPLRLERADFPVPQVESYSLDGTPADCVKAALDAILPEKPDVVLSGINHGYNVGFDVVYSGTVGAAMEALMNGIPAIALSQNDVGSFSIAEEYLPGVLSELLRAAPSAREIWNVNFPSESCRGILRDRTVASDGYYSGSLYRSQAEGATHVQYPPMLDVDNSVPRGAEDSDLNAVIRGYISIGRLRCPVL
ncbi:MAG: 5'/3'-nucleotidase SurE [Faecousia sp.]